MLLAVSQYCVKKQQISVLNTTELSDHSIFRFESELHTSIDC